MFERWVRTTTGVSMRNPLSLTHVSPVVPPPYPNGVVSAGRYPGDREPGSSPDDVLAIARGDVSLVRIDGVAAIAAHSGVAPGAVACVDHVVAATTLQGVVAWAADQSVGAAVAVERVAPGSTRHAILAPAAVDRIRAAQGVHRVRARLGVDRVAALRADERIVARGALNRRGGRNRGQPHRRAQKHRKGQTPHVPLLARIP